MTHLPKRVWHKLADLSGAASRGRSHLLVKGEVKRYDLTLTEYQFLGPQRTWELSVDGRHYSSYLTTEQMRVWAQRSRRIGR